MEVEIKRVLSAETHTAFLEAHSKFENLRDIHKNAEEEAFMKLMEDIDVKIGDKVSILESFSTNYQTAILAGPKRFSKIKKDGTASTLAFHVIAPYTVKKYNQPE